MDNYDNTVAFHIYSSAVSCYLAIHRSDLATQ